MKRPRSFKEGAHRLIPTLLAVCSALSGWKIAYSQEYWVGVEPSLVWTGRNYFQIPGDDSATRVDLPSGTPSFAYRAEGGFRFGSHWLLRFLYAPLTANCNFTPGAQIFFNGQSFESSVPTRVSYKFNSYRASLIREWTDSGLMRVRLGFTAKIRDAFIDVSNSNRSSRYSNVGFVPLLYLGGTVPIDEDWALVADLEGLAGGPGRAFDGRAHVEYEPFEQHHAALGYRFVEGGVKNDKVKNFALFHFVYFSYQLNF